MDVKTAFLNGQLSETIYVEQPHGFKVSKQLNHVCKLNLALYGLKQAARVWNKTLEAYLIQIGFIRLDPDNGVFYHTKITVIIAVYVDDLLLFGPSRNDVDSIKSKLSARFSMSDLGPCHFYLGIEIIRNRKRRIIYLSQQAFVDKILNLFNYQSLNLVATLMEPNLELPKFDS